MRVALLSQNACAGDAIGRHIAEKAAYFLDRGAHVRVIVGDDRRIHPALRPISIRHTERPQGDGWSELLAADLIVVDYPQYYPLLDLLPLLADGKRRIVFDYHGVTPPSGRLANHREALHRGRESIGFAGFADAVIPHSRFAEEELLGAAAIPENRRHRLGYVIDAARFTPGDAKIPLQKRLGLVDVKLLLFVGRLAPNKRVPILVQALRKLPDCHAVIVGPCGDIYESERLLCREVAADAGVTDRVHFLGNVDEATLLDCYRSADAFVMPSEHEGFCLPVIEAMACGLPVIAARAGALPETVGDAGLTFAPNDPIDLAKKVRRVFRRLGGGFAEPTESDPPAVGALRKASTHPTHPKRIAIVTPAFGEPPGGAERSLSLMAKLLHERGHKVEVLTTRVESATASFPVRLFAAEGVDPSRRAAALEQLDAVDPDTHCAGRIETIATARSASDGRESLRRSRSGLSPEHHEATYFANTLRSSAIVEALKTSNYDAVIVGPFGTALTRDVVRSIGDRVVFVPCLHDEPVAYTATVRQMFESVGGVLFHSREEQQLAQTTFGFNHPNATVMGTWIDANVTGDASRSMKLTGCDRYVLVCGRKVREKGLPEVIAFARQYESRNPGRFRFVFAGEGDYPIPHESWATDLGRVDETTKHDLMAGAAALVQMSVNESLSLVVLESQTQGIPVIVNGNNPTLRSHVTHGNGGWAVANEHEFAQALDTLWNQPEVGVERGRRGRDYVRREFGDPARMISAISEVVDNLDRPITTLMRERGLRRAQEFDRKHWRRNFDGILEAMFDQPTVVMPTVVDVVTPDPVIVDARTWRVILRHRDGLPLVSTGLGRTEVIARVRTADEEIIGDEWAVAIPRVLSKDQEIAVDVLLPALSAGMYALEAGIRTHHGEAAPIDEWHGMMATLNVSASPVFHEPHTLPAPRFQRTIDAARSLQQLPDGYVDVTTGRFAAFKKRIKDKLLNNFRASYVDVLARQQSRFNRQVTGALAELAEERTDGTFRAELAATQARCAELADRLGRLEMSRRENEVTIGGER